MFTRTSSVTSFVILHLTEHRIYFPIRSKRVLRANSYNVQICCKQSKQMTIFVVPERAAIRAVVIFTFRTDREPKTTRFWIIVYSRTTRSGCSVSTFERYRTRVDIIIVVHAVSYAGNHSVCITNASRTRTWTLRARGRGKVTEYPLNRTSRWRVYARERKN